ncbi:MAG: sialate O-acetylesterase [Cytophagales bacterium]|nr:sialate O-acetylesterase [Cytophagales bacterium]
MIFPKLMGFHFLEVLLLCFLFSCSSPEPQPFVPAQIFGDHMVLQQQESVTIWGTGTPNDEVKAQGSWSDEYVATQVNENGEWRLDLPTPEAGGPYLLDVAQSDSLIRFEDVMIGEVWLASGQSNMEMPLTGYLPTEPINNYEEEIANANYPGIRFITVKRAISPMPINEFEGEWKVMSSETAAKSSATAYFFARKLHQELGVPVGIIHSSWGGTPVESWISKDKMLELGEFEKQLATLAPEKIEVFQAWYDQFPARSFPDNEAGWESLDMEDGQYALPDFDDSNWRTTNLPDDIENMEGTYADGAVWFRKKVTIDNLNEAYTFSVTEGIDDMESLYINGKPVAFTLCWNCPRSYELNGIFKEGENQIAIRLIDTGGGGGFRGEMTLTSASGQQIDVNKDWKYLAVAGVFQGKLLMFDANQEALKNPPAGIADYRFDSWTPSGLFNAMINPVIPYNIQGAIWYQGESNVGRAEQYEKTFPGMITDWRTRWKGEFSFYFVQIAPFGYGNELSPALRDAQRKTLSIPGTGMASAMDIGHPTSIHPGNKQDVGKRLALWALAKDYGKSIVPSGPLYSNHRVEGSKIIVTFDHAESGLMLADGKGMPFEIAGGDGKFVQAEAALLDGNLVIWSTDVSEPKHVRYAWKDYVDAALFNETGLPASSFSTE